jgi:hypothetical protein
MRTFMQSAKNSSRSHARLCDDWFGAICFRSLPSNFALTFKFMSGALTEIDLGDLNNNDDDAIQARFDP